MTTLDITRLCTKCGQSSFGMWTSSSTGKVSLYCKPCRDQRRTAYDARKVTNGGSHTRAEWKKKLAEYSACPRCARTWTDIPPRPDRRYRNPWTKDHIVALLRGGSDAIENIQPLCYQCNFKKNAGI
jgi:5-methylcytosine-specific restriction endonuclease McrA